MPRLGVASLDGFASFGERLHTAKPEFGARLEQAATALTPLDNVRLDHPKYRTQNGETARGGYQPANPSSTLWTVGLTYPTTLFASRAPRRAALGLQASGPFGELRKFRASTPYDFFTLRDTLSESQFRASLLGAVELIERTLVLRAGLQFFVTSSGNAEAVLIGQNPTARLAADVGLNSAALLGLSWQTDRDTVAVSFRQEVAPLITQGFTGQIAIGGMPTFEQPVIFRTTLYFEPHRVEASYRHEFADLSLKVGLGYEAWSRYQPAFIKAETRDANGAPYVTEMPQVELRDTWNPEVSLSSSTTLPFTWGLGYRYSPSPVVDTAGPVNLLDSSLHQLSATAGTRLDSVGMPGWFASLKGDYGWWSERKVTKTNDDFIGAPGYTIRGHRYRVGTEVRVEL